MASGEPDFLTAAEVALRLRTSPWAIVKHCRQGDIRATKPGKTWLIEPADLDAWIERHRNTPAEAAS